MTRERFETLRDWPYGDARAITTIDAECAAMTKVQCERLYTELYGRAWRFDTARQGRETIAKLIHQFRESRDRVNGIMAM